MAEIISTQQLLIGLVDISDAKLAPIFDKFQLTVKRVRAVGLYGVETLAEKPASSTRGFRISRVFWLLALIALVSDSCVYYGIDRFDRFPFMLSTWVIATWIVSLSLHEFGHGLVVYWHRGRDQSEDGYLSLDPGTYFHWSWALIYAPLSVLAGEIGLPLGVRNAHRLAAVSRTRRSLVAAGGPLMTLGLTAVFALPLIFQLHTLDNLSTPRFWSGISILFYLHLSSLLINLLPLPGLDGFELLRPFLPISVQFEIASRSDVWFYILVGLIVMDTPLHLGLEWLTRTLGVFFGLEWGLLEYGFFMLRFWLFY